MEMLLPILIPILGSVFLVGLRDKKKLHLCTSILVLLTSVFAWMLILRNTGNVLELVRFSNSLVLSLKLDGLGRFFAGIVSILYPLTTLYAFEYLEEDRHQNVFFLFFVMAYGVTLGICLSANFFTLYCFYELLTLSTMPLVLHKQDRASVRAARTYLLLSIGGASLAFASMVYVNAVPVLERNTMTQLFYLLGFFGFGVKAAVFPLHVWLPKASVAPTPVTALLHAVAVVKSGVFAIIRLTYCIYGVENIQNSFAQNIALTFAIFTIFYGASMAFKETHFKRRLAYSTVANLSYILFGVLLMNEQGLTAGLMHMAFHAEIKILAFFAVGAVNEHAKKEYLWEIDGLGKKIPITYACYTVAALALTGIPPFAGFVSKSYLLMAGFASGSTLGIAGSIVLLISALLTAFYSLTPVRRAFFPDKDADLSKIQQAHEAGGRMCVPMVFLAVSILMTGLFANSILSSVNEIACTLGRWL